MSEEKKIHPRRRRRKRKRARHAKRVTAPTLFLPTAPVALSTAITRLRTLNRIAS